MKKTRNLQTPLGRRFISQPGSIGHGSDTGLNCYMPTSYLSHADYCESPDVYAFSRWGLSRGKPNADIRRTRDCFAENYGLRHSLPPPVECAALSRKPTSHIETYASYDGGVYLAFSTNETPSPAIAWQTCSPLISKRLKTYFARFGTMDELIDAMKIVALCRAAKRDKFYSPLTVG